ncbi:MAG: asparagine synthase (glutamine-hydrolyzing) [Flavobacteriales bacterium]|nr:asparagine synthase (glutamine-hydrolyzing) [Flavobacteriales bacterium]MBK9700818.1 asparagine synthase (glutamine-hydrolyzing) [Flavobacteriales bacterium]
MCGIAGIAGHPRPEEAAAAVGRMNEAQRHRGPDSGGLWSDADVALGHRRLKIIDLSSAADQPFHSADGRHVLVFNGEIYNYRELRTELERLPGVAPFRTGSDTEVLAAALTAWGPHALDRLQGMFAFAWWDRTERRLLLARDRLGIKPLYVHESGGRLAFASELRALLASGLVPRALDPDGLVDHLRYQTVHAPRTLVAGVRMLMPGHWMSWCDGRIEEGRYWDLVANARREAADLSVDSVQREVRERLSRAVERRLVADVPFGAFLSGGIDSSAVVGLMAQAGSAPVSTFSVVFDEEEFSEERYARIVAKKFGTRHTAIRLRPDDMLRLLPHALAAMDHPSGDGPNTYVVSKVTREAGITMALSGLGGDEVFAGYPVFTRTDRLWRWRALGLVPPGVRGLAGDLAARLRPSAATAKLPGLLRAPGLGPEHSYPFSRIAFLDPDLRRLVSTATLPENAVAELLQARYGAGAGTLPLLSQVSVAELDTYLPNVLLRDTDQMSMAHALEVRVPFLDHELVEFVLGVSDTHKYPHSPKKLLVDALGDLLPERIVNRPKMGFTLPWEHWMRNELRSFCEARLHTLGTRPVFRRDGVRSLWTRFLAGDRRVNWARVWGLVVLADWLDTNRIEA